MIINDAAQSVINSPVRSIYGKVELFEGSTLVRTFSYNDVLQSFIVERVGESSKFFGFDICQKINVKIVDPKSTISINTGHSFKIYLNDVRLCPIFEVSEVHRDENTGLLSITAYDKLYKAPNYTVAELGFTESDTGSLSYTLEEFANKSAELLGLAGVSIQNVTDPVFSTLYESGANFEGTETIREALVSLAEATQTICYINRDNFLVFKRLDIAGDPVFILDKSKYFSLTSGDNRRLGTIYSVTDLGDDVYASTLEAGSTQYIRNNPFWDLREDIGTLIDNALAAVGGTTINQFECSWRGNFLLELGDKIGIVTKDNRVVCAYLLDDSLNYDGTFDQLSRWDYEESEAEASDNPTSLGEALKETYAKVNKADKEIKLVASETSSNSAQIASIQLNTDRIVESVERMELVTSERFEELGDAVGELTSKVETTISAEDIKFEIKSQLSAGGIDTITTSTGFTFNEEGLSVEKEGSEMRTHISEDGMTVYKNDEEMLCASNVGVTARNLHAVTYLIIGLNSRFEDFAEGTRTGCFWVGR